MMTSVNKVEEMAQAQTAKPEQSGKRKAKLSPEVSEFLHMLKSLESEFGTEPPGR
jgi:hypothetical protein